MQHRRQVRASHQLDDDLHGAGGARLRTLAIAALRGGGRVADDPAAPGDGLVPRGAGRLPR
jgi:hypothetical protein